MKELVGPGVKDVIVNLYKPSNILTSNSFLGMRAVLCMWSQGRHFRIAMRDASKSTLDSFISAYFNIGLPKKQEFIGQIHQIMKLNYDTVKLVLLKCKWYKNNMTP
jgi:hypothetical protein